MRSLTFWLLGFVCGFFIGGMVEQAEAFTPTSSPYIERYERIATRYWADVPDCQRVEYLWPAEDPFGNDDALAYADIGGCRMWLVYWEPLQGAAADRSEAYSFNCATFVHEWGHLVGFDHGAAGFRSGRLYGACDRAARLRYSSVKVLKAAKPKRKHHRPKVRRIQDFNDPGPRATP